MRAAWTSSQSLLASLATLALLTVVVTGNPMPMPLRSSSLTLQHVFHRSLYQNGKRDVLRANAQPFAAADISQMRSRPRFTVKHNVKNAAPNNVNHHKTTGDNLWSRMSPLLSIPIWSQQAYGMFDRPVHSTETNDRKSSDKPIHVQQPVLIPDITDKETVLSLAEMAANAYTLSTLPDWFDIPPYHTNISFGWSKTGMRGYAFATEDNSLIVITIKGTSAVFLGIGSETAEKDKINDNRMFSCCCGRVDRTWSPVCGCFSGSVGMCNSTCLLSSTRYEDSYYEAGIDLYKTISMLYPHSTIWFAGHSLGGAVAATLGMTFNLPAVTFEAPGELLFARRVGLAIPADMSTLPIYHFGHDADPIFIGRCKGPRSSCYFAGYAMETRCHIGHTCMYNVRQINSINDTTGIGNDSHHDVDGREPAPQLNWGVDLRHHRIHDVIKFVLRLFPTVPKCEVSNDCKDCTSWSFT